MRKLHIAVTVFITAFFLALGVFVFYRSYLRFAEAAFDMGRSVGVYFCELFAIPYSFSASVYSCSIRLISVVWRRP